MLTWNPGHVTVLIDIAAKVWRDVIWMQRELYIARQGVLVGKKFAACDHVFLYYFKF
jgi:hypothetical protein